MMVTSASAPLGQRRQGGVGVDFVQGDLGGFDVGGDDRDQPLPVDQRQPAAQLDTAPPGEAPGEVAVPFGLGGFALECGGQLVVDGVGADHFDHPDRDPPQRRGGLRGPQRLGLLLDQHVRDRPAIPCAGLAGLGFGDQRQVDAVQAIHQLLRDRRLPEQGRVVEPPQPLNTFMIKFGAGTVEGGSALLHVRCCHTLNLQGATDRPVTQTSLSTRNVAKCIVRAGRPRSSTSLVSSS